MEQKTPQVGPETTGSFQPGNSPVRSSWRDLPETSQKYYPDYFFAGFWIRLFAYVIDLLCISAITTILLGTIFNLAGLTRGSGTFSLFGLLSLVIYLAYFALLTKYNHGQTIGKMIFGIRVVCFTEEQLSWATVLVREVACRFILKTPPFILGYLITIFTPNKQHLGDYFADTSVVTLNLIKAQQESGELHGTDRIS
ncbi:RDD family protein [Enterococcus sp. CSURQ0835]|uniref:RDD family protein n=1 Tax=Enterococcus sp. CSURQ0835 TaxID=2681394 RepID=UPI00135A1BE5|nr:RDD family protein [Enterococcus sp. CSURQ0835]